MDFNFRLAIKQGYIPRHGTCILLATRSLSASESHRYTEGGRERERAESGGRLFLGYLFMDFSLGAKCEPILQFDHKSAHGYLESLEMSLSTTIRKWALARQTATCRSELSLISIVFWTWLARFAGDLPFLSIERGWIDHCSLVFISVSSHQWHVALSASARDEKFGSESNEPQTADGHAVWQSSCGSSVTMPQTP